MGERRTPSLRFPLRPFCLNRTWIRDPRKYALSTSSDGKIFPLFAAGLNGAPNTADDTTSQNPAHA